MNYHQIRSSSSSTNLHQSRSKTDNLQLEPLLSTDSDLEPSPDGLSIGEDRRDFQSVYLTFLSRLRNWRCPMAIRSSRLFCFEVLKWIPVVFILAILGWSYYAYVVQMCILTIESFPKKVIYLCLYHPLIILCLWSYYRTIFQPFLGPSRQFYVGETEGDHIATAQTIDERRAILVRLARQANLPLLTRHFDGSIRYCFVCRCIKPDRAHHCSVCEKCVLRYDHHCPWTNNCVSYGNYKFFVLFLGYALVLCTYVATTSLEYFILFWQGVSDVQKEERKSASANGKFHLLFLFFASMMFVISVSSLFFYHLFLTAKNRTTLESFRASIFANGPQQEGFNLGSRQNFHEIFGSNLLKALIPVFTTRGDGIHFQMNSVLLGGLQPANPTSTFDRRSNHSIHEQVNNTLLSPFNRSSDTLLPVDPSPNPISNARHSSWLPNVDHNR